MHKVKWQQVGTNGDIVQQYLLFVRRNYGCNAVTIFDGYLNGPSNKDVEHDRRLRKLHLMLH